MCRLCLVDLRDQELRVGEGKARTESDKEDRGSSAASIGVIGEIARSGVITDALGCCSEGGADAKSCRGQRPCSWNACEEPCACVLQLNEIALGDGEIGYAIHVGGGVQHRIKAEDVA